MKFQFTSLGGRDNRIDRLALSGNERRIIEKSQRFQRSRATQFYLDLASMERTYKATGINLKTMPLGESDRLLTVLTSEYGLVRAIAPGARKPKSSLRGRSELFVVNELLVVKGRSLDKIIQAETRESYPGLSKDLSKLAASQYLAELALGLGLSEQPQVELYELLTEHLRRLERVALTSPCDPIAVLSHLAQGIFHLLANAGFAPEVQTCRTSGRSLVPDLSDPHWRVQFNVEVGGIFREDSEAFGNEVPARKSYSLNSLELSLLQQLAASHLAPLVEVPDLQAGWLSIERILRDYTQYHLGKSIRSAVLLDTLFLSDF